MRRRLAATLHRTSTPRRFTIIRKRIAVIFATLAAVIGAVTVSVPADAYLHVANAQRTCVNTMYVYADAWSKQNFGPGGLWYTAVGSSYTRINDHAVIVDCGFLGNAGWYPRGQQPSEMIARTYMIGDDDTAAPYFGGGYPAWPYLGVQPYCSTAVICPF